MKENDKIKGINRLAKWKTYHNSPFYIFILLLIIGIIFTCNKTDNLYTPDDEESITINAFVADTTGVHTTVSKDSIEDALETEITIKVGQTVTFLGFISGDSNLVTQEWDFGDGNTSKQRIIEHAYAETGNYKAVFSITDESDFSLSDTVLITVEEISGAAIRGYAFYEGKSAHDSIEVVFKSEISVLTPIYTDRTGLYRVTSDFPSGTYTVTFTTKRPGYSVDTLKDIFVENGVLTVIDSVILKDTDLPYFTNNNPKDTIHIRKPVITADFFDTCSGIDPETFVLIFNGDIIEDSLITIDTSNFSLALDYRLPDGNHTVFSAISDSAGNRDSIIWIFTVVPAVNAGNDTTVGLNAPVNLHGTATEPLSPSTSVKWEWKFGNSQWVETSSGDTSIIAPSTAQTFICSLKVTYEDVQTIVDYINIYITVFFTPHTITTSADDARSVFAIDLDGDGDIDVLSASGSGWEGKIAWYENDGAESFLAHTIKTSVRGANSVFAIDLDGDGDIDVLSGSDTTAWYENDGEENFTTYAIGTSAGARSVFAIDLDGDDDIDVLLAFEGSNKMSWYENDGSENFTAHTITTSTNCPYSVFAIDINGDGDIDVLSASEGDDKIAWYENDGAEDFTPHTITTSADHAASVFAIDVDSDGDIDVLSASDNKIAWYENDGSENFIAHTITTSTEKGRSVFAIDLDGDGDIDVLSASETDNKIAWYENDGTENFTAHTITTSADAAQSVYAIDLDGDGDIDILSASYNDDKIAWYENK